MEKPPSLKKIFTKCLDYTLNIEWRDIFADSANGNYPYGMYIQNDEWVIINRKNNQTKRKIPYDEFLKNKDYSILFTFFLDIFKSDLGLYSKSEQKELWAKFKEENVDDLTPTEKMKNKSFRANAFKTFILDLKRKNGWSDYNASRLLSLIKLFFEIDYIKINDIIFEENKIIYIKTIIIDEQGNLQRSKM